MMIVLGDTWQNKSFVGICQLTQNQLFYRNNSIIFNAEL